MVKDLTKEQNQFASYEDQLKAEAQEAEVDLYANPLATYNPQSLQTKAVAPQDLSGDAMIYQLSRDPNNAKWLAPIPIKELDNRSALTRFGASIVGQAIDTGGLALQGIAESIAAGTATDDDYKNWLESFVSGKDSSLWRAGQAVRDGQREIFGEVDVTDDKIADDLGGALGSLIPSIGAGYATAFPGAYAGAAIGSVVPGVGTAIGAAVGGAVGFFAGSAMFGAGVMTGEMAQRARDLGYDEYDIEFKKAVAASFGLGTSEVLPAGAIAGKIGLNKYLSNSAVGGALYQATKKIPGVNTAVKAYEKINPKARQIIGDMFTGLTAGALVEGGQEYAQAIGQDYIEQLFLDPEKTIEWSANTYEGVLGGFAGGTLGVIVFPFAKAKTRRLAKNKKDIEDLTATVEELNKEIKLKTVVTPEEEFSSAYFGDEEIEVDEITDPFDFIDDTPFDDTGADWKVDKPEFIDVWTPGGKKKKAKVIARDEESGSVRFEVDGQEFVPGFEYDLTDPLGDDFKLGTKDGEGTLIKPKDLSDSQLLAMIEDRRNRIKKLIDGKQKGAGGYFVSLREGLALKTEAERRGIYKKPTVETKAVKETVEELDPKDIADTATVIDSMQGNRIRPSVQRAVASNKEAKSQSALRTRLKDERRSKRIPQFLGKVAFISRGQAQKLVDQFGGESSFIDETKLGLRSNQALIGTAASSMNVGRLVETIKVKDDKGKLVLQGENLDSIKSYLEEGANAIPILLDPEGIILTQEQAKINEYSDDVLDFYLPDGSKLEYDKRSWSNTFNEETKKVVKKKSKGPKVPTKSTPKFGPFGNELNGKIIGTENVPDFALGYAEQILEKLNMKGDINIFFYTDKDTQKNGKIKAEVLEKHNVQPRLTRKGFFSKEAKRLNMTLRELYYDTEAYATVKKNYNKYQEDYILDSGSDNVYGFVNQFGPDAFRNHTYKIFLNTSNTRGERAKIFPGIQNADLQRSTEDISILNTTAHEVGHILEWELFNNATNVEKVAVLRDYYAYLSEGDKKQNLEFNKSNISRKLTQMFESEKYKEGKSRSKPKDRAARRGQDLGNDALTAYLLEDGTIDVDSIVGDLNKISNFEFKKKLVSGEFRDRPIGDYKYGATYQLSFSEWFAEQTARWSMERIPPKTMSEKFFKRVSEIWEKIFATTKATPGFKFLMDNRASNKLWRSRFINQRAPPAKRSPFSSNTPTGFKNFTPLRGEQALRAKFDEETIEDALDKLRDSYEVENENLLYIPNMRMWPFRIEEQEFLEDYRPEESNAEIMMDADIPIARIIEEPEIVEAVTESVEATSKAVEEEIADKTEAEVTATVAEPIDSDGDGGGERTSSKAKRPPGWKVSFLRWAASPLALWSMRNDDGSYVYPKIRKAIERMQFNQQTVTAQMSKLLKKFREDIADVKKSGEWSDVSALVVEGDRRGVKFKNAELANGIEIELEDGTTKTIKLSAKGIEAYVATRNTFDTLGRMINEHNARINPKARRNLNRLIAEGESIFNSIELDVDKLRKDIKVEFEAIKDESNRRIIGYFVTVGDAPLPFKVMMSSTTAKNGAQLKAIIRQSKQVQDTITLKAEQKAAQFKKERAAVNFKESIAARQRLFDRLKTLYRSKNPDEASINILYDEIKAIEKEIGYTKRNTELDQAIVRIDIENARIKPEYDIMTNEGYMPHIWYGSHRVVLLKERSDGKGVLAKEIFSEQGYFNTEKEAQEAAENFIKANPKYEGDTIQVINRGTTWADSGTSARTIISDKIFDDLAVLLTADDLNSIRTGKQSLRALAVAKGLIPQKRRAEASFEKERAGAEGYSTDTEAIVGSHIQNVMRYLILDEMKYDAYEIQQQLSEDNDPLADEFEAYINDISNVEGTVENNIDGIFDGFFNTTDKLVKTITQGKVKSLNRAMVFGGMTGLGTAMAVGIMSPVIGAGLGLTFGYMAYGKVKKSMEAGLVSADGSVKVFDPFIQTTLGISAHTKLGMFFNLLSPVVNLSQTVINTASIFNYNETIAAMNITRRYVAGKISGSDQEFVAAWEKRFDDGGVDIDQGLFTDAQELNLTRGWIERNSMFLFQKAEVFNRMVAYSAGYTRAKNAGKSEAEAKKAGQKAWNDTQFFYDKADTSKLLRIKWLKTGTQFKNFLFKQTAFTFGLVSGATDSRPLEKNDGTFESKVEALERQKAMRIALLKQLLHIYALAGALGIPGLQLLDWLIRSLSEAIYGKEYSPTKELMRWNLDQQSKGESWGLFADVAVKGLPNLIGQDISSRVGLGNRFLPYNDRLSTGENLMDQFKGPWVSTLINARKLSQSGATLGDQTVNISSGIGKPLKGIEMLAGGRDLKGVIYNPSTVGQYAEAVIHNLANPSNIVYTSGYKKGQVISNKVSRADVFNYMIGGRPTDFSRESDLNELLQFDDAQLDKQVSRVYTKMAVAYTQYARSNPDRFYREMEKLRKEAIEKNIPINNGTIKRMFRTLRTPRAINTIKKLRKSQRPEYYKYIEEYL